AAPIAVGLRQGAAPDKPLAPLLTVAGASTALGKPSSLVDGDPTTTWSEARPGAGTGEFVVFRAPDEISIPRLSITIAPPNAAPTAGAAPKTFFVVTDKETFSVTLPEDAWLHPGAAYDLPFAQPLRTACLA